MVEKTSSNPDWADQLRRLNELMVLAGGGGRRWAAETFSTGCPPLDRRLPRQGFGAAPWWNGSVRAPAAERWSWR